MFARTPLPPLSSLSCVLLASSLAASSAHAANRPPTARDAELDVDEDAVLTATLEAEDDDKDALTFSIVKPPKSGEAQLESDGKLRYTPKKNWSGKDELTFQVTDGKAKITKRCLISVRPINDPPAAAPVSLTGQEDKPLKGQVTATDPDGDPLSYRYAGDRIGVIVDDRRGSFTFAPQENENGSFKLSIVVSDGTIDVEVPVTITLAPQNDAPTTVSSQAKGNEDEKILGKIAAEDVDNDALSYALGEAPKHGTVEIDAQKGSYVYTPQKDFNGDDTFTFTVSDGKLSAKNRATVDIVGVNDPPYTSPVSLEGNEDTPIKGKVVGKDADGDAFYFEVKVDPKHGEVDIDRTTGDITFLPEANWNGTESFKVDVGDIGGSAVSVVTVVVRPQNDAPSAADGSYAGEEDKPVSGKLKADDVDKDALTFSLLKPPKLGTATVNADGSFTFTPNPNANGDDSFTFEVTDGKAKAQATAALKLRPVNDAPTTSDVQLGTREDTAARGRVVAKDIDTGDVLSFAVAKPAGKGEATIDEQSGAFSYTPSKDSNGEDRFVVEVSDGAGGKASATVTVAVEPVNDAPVASAAESKGDEDTPIKGTLVATDVDKDALRYAVIGKPRLGSVDVNADTGAYTYTPSANLNGADEFRFEVTDGKLKAQASIKLAIAAVNDTPVPKPLSLATAEDKPTGGNVVATDIDKDTLRYAIGKPAQKGKAEVDAATGKVSYAPALNENGDDSFTVIVDDGALERTKAPGSPQTGTAELTVAVAIAPVNDAPIANAFAGAGKEDEPIQGTLTGSDVDKDVLTFSAATKPRAGAITVDPQSGAFSYTPNANFHGDDGCTFEISDGKLKARAELKLTVAAVNDAPQAKDLALSTAEDREVTGKIVASDIDSAVDKDVLTYRLKTPPHEGVAFVDDATGTVRFVPAKDHVQPTSFVVEVTDGLASADAKVDVAIAAQPDAPLFDPRPLETAEDEPAVAKLVALDADADALLSFKIAAPSRLGDAVVEGEGASAVLRFTPKPDVHGEDAIALEVSDGKNKVRAALPVRVAARNDLPTVDDVKLEVLEDTTVDVPLTVRDRDGDPVKLALVLEPDNNANGNNKPADPKAKAPPAPAPNVDVKLANNSLLSVTPRASFAGTVELGVVPSDPTAKGALAHVTLTFINVNDAPVTKDLGLRVEPGKALTGQVEASDVDVGDELTFTLAVPPRLGTATLDDPKAGRFNYTPNAGALGEDSFRVRIKDKAGASVSSTVRVTIAPTPVAPPPPPSKPPPPKTPPKPAPATSKKS